MVEDISQAVKKHIKSHQNAWNGIFLIVKTQNNFRIELLLTVCVFIAGWYYKLSLVEWYGVAFSITLVLVAEALNSALESACDAITTRHMGAIRYAKDVAAGAVVITVACALVVGLMVFLPHLVPTLHLP